MMHGSGFSGSPHYIARPLGRNDWLNRLLVIEYCYGELLSSITCGRSGTATRSALCEADRARLLSGPVPQQYGVGLEDRFQ